MRRLSILSLALLAATTPTSAKPPTAAEFERVRRHVVPTKKDMLWAKVGWRPTLWDAVIDAHKEKKPILLWAMNGHALACT